MPERDRPGSTEESELLDWGAILRDASTGLEALAEAIERDDDEMGHRATVILLSTLPALPVHLRELLHDLTSEEAARGLRAVVSYFGEKEAGGGS